MTPSKLNWEWCWGHKRHFAYVNGVKKGTLCENLTSLKLFVSPLKIFSRFSISFVDPEQSEEWKLNANHGMLRKLLRRKKKSEHVLDRFFEVWEKKGRLMASDPKLKAEIGPDGLAREAPVIAYTEKVKLLSVFVWVNAISLVLMISFWKLDNRGRAASVEEVSTRF